MLCSSTAAPARCTPCRGCFTSAPPRRMLRAQRSQLCRASDLKEELEKPATGEVKRWKVMGMEVFESDETLPEPQADFWTGDKMEGVNNLMKAYLPLMFVAALACGGLAARFFNDGASVYIKPATSDDSLPATFYETPEGGFVQVEENPLFK